MISEFNEQDAFLGRLHTLPSFPETLCKAPSQPHLKKYYFLLLPLPQEKAAAAGVTCPQIISESNILDGGVESDWAGSRNRKGREMSIALEKHRKLRSVIHTSTNAERGSWLALIPATGIQAAQYPQTAAPSLGTSSAPTDPQYCSMSWTHCEEGT